tara:strand:+ start:553 stop:1248 length:696 start_codon:yes stop_codon:yes gene_type:complete
MASTFSSDLKLELMATGENSGTWGTKTNSNLNLVQQSVAGFEEIAVASGDVTLVMSNASISNARNMTLKFTGTLAGNRIVNMPASIEKIFNVVDGTDHANNTLTFKVTGQTGFLLCEGNKYICHSNGTDIFKDHETATWRAITASETVQGGALILADTSGGAFTVTLPASPSAGDTVQIVDKGFNFNNANLTVGRNSKNIRNTSSDVVLSTAGTGINLVYTGDNTTGWLDF